MTNGPMLTHHQYCPPQVLLNDRIDFVRGQDGGNDGDDDCSPFRDEVLLLFYFGKDVNMNDMLDTVLQQVIDDGSAISRRGSVHLHLGLHSVPLPHSPFGLSRDHFHSRLLPHSHSTSIVPG